MVITEASREELKAIIAAFKSHPLIKEIAKTSNDNINAFADRLTKEQVFGVYRALSTVMKNPIIREFIMKRAQSHALGKPFKFEWASFYCWVVKEFVSSGQKAARGSISAEAKKAIQEWINSNTGAELPSWIEDELLTIPEIRPDTPILLYRGLLFSKSVMEPTFNPYRPWRAPKNYIAAIMVGKRAVKINSPVASSWSTSRATAERFATSKAATSQYSAMTNWLNSAKTKSAIQGEMGLLLSVIAQPEDIICDMNRLDIGLNANHGNESEVILRGGERLARMTCIWTPNGEVSIEEFQQHMAERNKPKN